MNSESTYVAKKGWDSFCGSVIGRNRIFKGLGVCFVLNSSSQSWLFANVG